MFSVVRTACPWRNLTKDFAPWRTVYHYFRLWKRTQLWEQIHTHLREHLRPVEERQRHATAGILDSQSVQSTEYSDQRGCDAGKKVNGRKRHTLVDTLGLVLRVRVIFLRKRGEGLGVIVQNRGVQDILITVVDGLKGFPDAINTAFPPNRGADLYCALGAAQIELCRLAGSQTGGRRTAHDLSSPND